MTENGWKEDKRYMEAALDRIDKSLFDLNEKFDETRIKTVAEITELKTKMGLIGGLAGGFSAVVVSIIAWVIRGGGHGQ